MCSYSIDNRLLLLLEAFIELRNSRRINIILKESIIEAESVTAMEPSIRYNNRLYIFNNIKYEKYLLFSNILLHRDNELYFALFRKRNKFKNELIDILEKEILNG